MVNTNFKTFIASKGIIFVGNLVLSQIGFVVKYIIIKYSKSK